MIICLVTKRLLGNHLCGVLSPAAGGVSMPLKQKHAYSTSSKKHATRRRISILTHQKSKQTNFKKSLALGNITPYIPYCEINKGVFAENAI
jgi:hypothetical protein